MAFSQRTFFFSYAEVCAKDRVLKILDQLQLELGEDTVQEIEKKLVVMVGDLSKPKLGLCTEDYRTLCEEVDTIIHNGATVNSVLPYAGTLNWNTVLSATHGELTELYGLC